MNPVLPRSVDALTAAWTTDSERPSALIGHLTASAIADNAGDRIYTAILADRSRREASRLETQYRHMAPRQLPPLFGVPVAIKDNIDLCGEPTSCGSRALARGVPLRDAAVVRRLESLGAVVIGKTNLDEAALGASGRNEHFGRCRNPRGALLLSGGSSSGSAAAVAKRHVLLAVGTDTLGSVRIPAALCGVVGFKPSHAVIPMDGVTPLYPEFDTVGLLAGSLPDIESVSRSLGLDAQPSRPAHEPRIMLLADSALGWVDAAVASSYRHCCDLLRRSAALQFAELPAFDFVGVSRAALWEVSSDFATRIGFRDPAFAAQRAALGVELRRLLDRASTLPESKLLAGRALLHDARQRIAAYLAAADAILTPTCSTDAIGAAADVPKDISAFVVPANLGGLPAISWPQDGVPGSSLSLQLIGRAGTDGALIRLAGRLRTLLNQRLDQPA